MGPDNTIIVGTSQRSSIESCKNMIANQVASTFKLAGAEVKHGDGYPGWAPNPNSKILKVAQDTYKKLSTFCSATMSKQKFYFLCFD